MVVFTVPSCLCRADYILRGPLVEACGFTAEAVSEQLPIWLEYGQEAARSLGFGGPDTLDDVQKCATTCMAADAVQRAGKAPASQQHGS